MFLSESRQILAGLKKNGEKISIRSEVQRFFYLVFKKVLEINVLFSDLRKKKQKRQKHVKKKILTENNHCWLF